eukprot:4270616-Amphidinium_carterae.1
MKTSAKRPRSSRKPSTWSRRARRQQSLKMHTNQTENITLQFYVSQINSVAILVQVVRGLRMGCCFGTRA